jgi:hypothetical protein
MNCFYSSTVAEGSETYASPDFSSLLVHFDLGAQNGFCYSACYKLAYIFLLPALHLRFSSLSLVKINMITLLVGSRLRLPICY